jgi:Amt family ammonium transporter
LLKNELIASGIVILYSAVMTYVILQILRKFTRIRVTESEEALGLDRSQHGEVAYEMK